MVLETNKNKKKGYKKMEKNLKKYMKKDIEITELTPNYYKQKSYYGKAKVVKKDKLLSLYSYNTLIITLDTDKDNKCLYFDIDSITATTAKHMREFFYSYRKDIDLSFDKYKIWKTLTN